MLWRWRSRSRLYYVHFPPMPDGDVHKKPHRAGLIGRGVPEGLPISSGIMRPQRGHSERELRASGRSRAKAALCSYWVGFPTRLRLGPPSPNLISAPSRRRGPPARCAPNAGARAGRTSSTRIVWPSPALPGDPTVASRTDARCGVRRAPGEPSRILQGWSGLRG